MIDAIPFVLDRFYLTRCDLAWLHIVAKGEGINLRAKVVRVYLSREEVSGDLLKPGAEIEFCPYDGLDWHVSFEVGDRVLVSFDTPSGHIWQPHSELLRENIGNEPYGIYSGWRWWKCEGNKSVPFSIRMNARPDPKRSDATAIRLDVLEADIQASIEAIRHGYTGLKWEQMDLECMPDGCVLHYDLTDPMVASEVIAFVYHRARSDEIVAQRHAAMTERLRVVDGPFGLQSIAPPPAPLFADGGYWRQPDEARNVAFSGWYTFRSNRTLKDLAIEDDNFHYKFNARDARLDYKKLIHDDFKRAITALDGYRAIWNYSLYGLGYRRGRHVWPHINKQYSKLSRDKSLDVDGRNNIYTLYPAQYWDAELCQRALGHGPDEVIRRLQDKAPRAERLGDGVYLVLNDDPELRYDDFLALNNRYKPLLGLK